MSDGKSTWEKYMMTHAGISGFLARSLVYLFGGSLVWSFGIITFIVVNAYLKKAGTDFSLLKDSLVFLTTTSSIFSPLLAFVLGYYFNQIQRDTEAERRKDTSTEDGAIKSGDKANDEGETTAI